MNYNGKEASKMKIEVRYCSKTGNTKKVANAIADAIRVEAKSINESVLEADILFLGGAIYADQIPSKLKKFIEGLHSKKIKRVAIFCTSSSGKSIYSELKKFLDTKKIQVLDESFHCLGNFLFYLKGRPNHEDLKLAKTFAQKVIKEVNLCKN